MVVSERHLTVVLVAQLQGSAIRVRPLATTAAAWKLVSAAAAAVLTPTTTKTEEVDTRDVVDKVTVVVGRQPWPTISGSSERCVLLLLLLLQCVCGCVSKVMETRARRTMAGCHRSPVAQPDFPKPVTCLWASECQTRGTHNSLNPYKYHPQETSNEHFKYSLG
jgi:hypothetical protein